MERRISSGTSTVGFASTIDFFAAKLFLELTNNSCLEMKRSSSARGEHDPDTLIEAPVLKRVRFDEPFIHSIPLECLGAFLTCPRLVYLLTG